MRPNSAGPPLPEMFDQHEVGLHWPHLAEKDRAAIWGNAQAHSQRRLALEAEDVLDAARGKAKELNRKAGFRSRGGNEIDPILDDFVDSTKQRFKDLAFLTALNRHSP